MLFNNMKVSDYSIVFDEIIKKNNSNKLFLLNGEIGSGKTTLIKYFLKKLMVNSNVSSPTFNIINEYINHNNEHFFHFDLYRIKSIEELHVIGFNEYIDSKKICFIEWPEIATDIIFYDYLDIYIKADINEKREITITKYYKK